MDYKIIAPNKNYTGESAGVNFVNGVGIAKDGKSIDWFTKKGYEVEPMEEREKPETLGEPETPEEKKTTRGKSKNKAEENEGEAEGSDIK